MGVFICNHYLVCLHSDKKQYGAPHKAVFTALKLINELREFEHQNSLLQKQASVLLVLGSVAISFDWIIQKVKIKVTLELATKAQRGSRCIALLFLQPRR